MEVVERDVWHHFASAKMKELFGGFCRTLAKDRVRALTSQSGVRYENGVASESCQHPTNECVVQQQMCSRRNIEVVVRYSRNAVQQHVHSMPLLQRLVRRVFFMDRTVEPFFINVLF